MNSDNKSLDTLSGTYTQVKEPDAVYTRKDKYIGMIYFTLVGFSQLILWNSCINVMHVITNAKFGTFDITTYIATFQSLNLLVQYIPIRIGPIRLGLIHFSLFLSFVCSLMIPLITQVTEGLTTKVLLHILMAFVGMGSGLLSACQYSFSAIMYRSFCSCVIIGSGLSGIISFLLWILISNAFWSITIASELYKGLWLFFGLTAFLIGITFYGTFYISKISWFKKGIRDYYLSSDQVVNEIDPDVNTKIKLDNKFESLESEINESQLPPRKLKFILFDCRWYLFEVFFTMFITLCLFPSVGPLNWMIKQTWDQNIPILIGIFQLFDWLGRYIPSIKYCQMSNKGASICCYSRVLFVPLFVISQRVSNTVVINDFWFQIIIMILFSLTNGWFLCVLFNRVTDNLVRNSEKGIAATYGSLTLLSGITLGLWVTKLFLL